MTHVPNVEVLWWEGCPSTEKALAATRDALREAGLDPDTVHMREIDTDADAEEAGFLGSPTILIDGVDVAPTPEGEKPGLTCRIYRRRDGKIAPTPDPADIRDALARALAAGEAPA